MSLAEFRSPDIPEEFGPQESYVNKILGQERGPVIDTIAKSLGPMARQCRLSVCIPAYRESGVLERTLTEYTLRQVMPDGQPVDPESFEVNLLLNRPNASDPRDEGMVRIIEDFRARHPQYHVNVAEITYDFAGRAPIGRIFADIADAVVLRNTERPVSEQARSRLILRTAGADVEALNPLLISRTLSVFEDHSVVAHRGESRLPPELLREFPLLHVMQTFSIYAKRRLRGRLTMNGPFSYTADAYVRAGGFDTTLTV